MTISDKVVNNGGNELTRSELKETKETELTTKSEYGNYKIKISEVYDRGVVLASEEGTSNSVATSPTPSSTGNNGSMSNSGNTSGKTNTSVNNGNATNGGSTSGGTNISENSGNTGTGGNVNSTTEIDVTGIEIDKQTATIDINGENTLQLNSKLNPTNANKNTKITWTSKKKNSKYKHNRTSNRKKSRKLNDNGNKSKWIQCRMFDSMPSKDNRNNSKPSNSKNTSWTNNTINSDNKPRDNNRKGNMKK